MYNHPLRVCSFDRVSGFCVRRSKKRSEKTIQVPPNNKYSTVIFKAIEAENKLNLELTVESLTLIIHDS